MPEAQAISLLLETTALTRPGRERGLGRYTKACLEAAKTLGLNVDELSVKQRHSRGAEFLDLAERCTTTVGRTHDIVHFTNPLVWAPARPATITSILDIIPLDIPHYRKTGVKNRFFYSRAAHSKVILTISRFTANRVSDYFEIDPSRIVVAPLYPTSSFQASISRPEPEAIEVDKPYVLSVVDMATPDPRKRSPWITPLADELRAAGIHLVVAGAGTDSAQSSLGCAIGLGRVSDARLARLIDQATCFLYFSAYEGQGLPPLEAMATGAAVVSTANTAIVEVVGDAGILVEENAGHWSRALKDDSCAANTRKKLVEACVTVERDAELRQRLREMGLARASTFSVERFTDGLATAYQQATCA